VALDAGVEPRCRVAEALAKIFPPTAVPIADFERGEFRLAPFGRPAQLAPSPGAEFGVDYLFEAPPQRISGVKPDEMEQLMDENSGELGSRTVEGDPSLAQERRRMDRPSSILEARYAMKLDRKPAELWKTGGHRGGARLKDGVVGNKKSGARHSIGRVPPPAGVTARN